MDVVLGVALASSPPATIHTVLVGGDNGDGVILETHSFDLPTDHTAAFAAVDALIAAILRARNAADTAGYRLVSTGVTVTDPLDAAELGSRLAAGDLEELKDIALISPDLAAASLARNLGQTVGCDRMGLLSVGASDATLAVVDCIDGSITRLFRQFLADGDATAAVESVAERLNTPETRPDGLFLVCTAADATAIRPRLEATVGREVCEPAEPQTALARGAALASTQVTRAVEYPTAALAYTQEADSSAISPGYYDIPGLEADDLAYSAVPDEEDETATELIHPVGPSTRRPLLVAGTVLASATFAAASALMVSMALDITPNLVALRPEIGRALSFPLTPPKMQEPALQPYVEPPVAMNQPDALPLPPLEMPPAAPVSVPMPPSPAAPPVFGPALQPPPAAVPLASPFTFTPAPLPVPVPVPVHHSTPSIRPVAAALPDLSFLLGLPAKLPSAPTPPSVVPAPPLEIPAPPVVKPGPPDVKPVPPIVVEPLPPVVKPNPPVEIPIPPVVKPNPPVIKPIPPVIKPNSPVQLPDPPVVKPDPPVIKPNPPVIKPIPPVIKPNPPVQLPDPPVIKPNPPVQLPDPPIQLPDPPVQLPTPPVIKPNPPVQLPEAPIKLPDPPAANPDAPFQWPGLPISPPKSAPPAGLPQSPVIPSLPAPKAPAIPASPGIPAFNPPSLPGLPAPNSPALPSLPAPKAPAIPSLPAPKAPALPSLPAPGAPSLPKLGGGSGGGIFGGKPGGGIFGGNPGGGIFGGKPGGGIFGGGGKPGGGIFGGGGGGGLFGGGGGGLFGR